ncbi:hypothetical protein [Erythrobacter litoralis]|uniref:Uncharacterized protein n=1 Tax=Erythrobacter litoralis (strain HTCC2594) TaxID=314225 RepID=Q2NB01_ERYLH|nr:hypothetical protein [Erythrobacter litoralis]ABC63140.1 hypothetical protein ELI_05240 [Erythrobacter litoralis HTCC2594]
MSMVLAAALASSVENVPIFQRVAITDDVSVVAFGIIEDSRCSDVRFCFRDDELRVAAVLAYRGREYEVVLDWNRPLRVGDGLLYLTSAGTPANPNGAIRLEKYRLSLAYEPFDMVRSAGD